MDNTTGDGNVCLDDVGLVDHSHLAHDADGDWGTIEGWDDSTVLQVGGLYNALHDVVFEDGTKSLLAETGGGGSNLGESLVGGSKDGDIFEAVNGGSETSCGEGGNEAGEAGCGGSLGSGLQASSWLHSWSITIIIWAVGEGRSLSCVS